MKKLALLLAAAALPLSGCAVTSFAPPIVKMAQVHEAADFIQRGVLT